MRDLTKLYEHRLTIANILSDIRCESAITTDEEWSDELDEIGDMISDALERINKHLI